MNTAQPTEEGLRTMKEQVQEKQPKQEEESLPTQEQEKQPKQEQAKGQKCGICEQQRGQLGESQGQPISSAAVQASELGKTSVAEEHVTEVEQPQEKGEVETQESQAQKVGTVQEASKPKNSRIICIPCGLKENSIKTVEWANSKLLSPGDHVILVTVRDHRKQTMDQTVPKEVVDVSEVHSQKEDEKIGEVLNKFKDMMPERDVELKVLRGDKRKELVNYINELEPNFVVVGEAEISGIRRTFTTSTPSYLAQHLHVPLMIYRHATHQPVSTQKSGQEEQQRSQPIQAQSSEGAQEQKSEECACKECSCSPCECNQSQKQEAKNMQAEGKQMEEEGLRMQQKAREILDQGGESQEFPGFLGTSGQEEGENARGKPLKGSRTICIPCDLGEHTMKTVEWANSKLVTAEDHIVLVSVRDHRKQTLDQTVPKDVVDVSEVHSQKEDEKIGEVLNKFKDLMPERDVELKVLRGDKRKELVNYINELEPNFVLVGAREMSGIKRTFTNSTSEYLAQHLHVPVMIYRPQIK